MDNTVLKEHNAFLDYQVGRINVKINLSKTNKNLHYITPLTIPVGKMPIDLSLVYTYSESFQTEYFGKGIRSTLYKKVTEVSSNVWNVVFLGE